jgi:membrane-associated phospholipid phosphatase
VIFVICAVLDGTPFDVLLNVAFHRARPALPTLATVLHTDRFPSGNVIAATLLNGAAAAYIAAQLAEWNRQVLAFRLASTLIAFTRIYLGAHYVSDMLLTAAAGETWLALYQLAVVETRWYRRGCRPFSVAG